MFVPITRDVIPIGKKFLHPSFVYLMVQKLGRLGSHIRTARLNLAYSVEWEILSSNLTICEVQK